MRERGREISKEEESERRRESGRRGFMMEHEVRICAEKFLSRERRREGEREGGEREVMPEEIQNKKYSYFLCNFNMNRGKNNNSSSFTFFLETFSSLFSPSLFFSFVHVFSVPFFLNFSSFFEEGRNIRMKIDFVCCRKRRRKKVREERKNKETGKKGKEKMREREGRKERNKRKKSVPSPRF